MTFMRSSGILLPIASLPSPYGIGDFGPGAYRFADFLQATGQCLWQILPLTQITAGNPSPYTSSSAFAGNTYLLSPDLLQDMGLLSRKDLANAPSLPEDVVSYEAALAFKDSLFAAIPEAFQRHHDTTLHKSFDGFCRQNTSWLQDYTLYRACEQEFKTSWDHWPEDIRNRDPTAIIKLQDHLKAPIVAEKLLQFLFAMQWRQLKRYCNDCGILLIGDLSYFVDYYSADVWAHPTMFKLSAEKKPTVVSGVPPDYFSATGQLWNTPVYDWTNKETISWWLSRLHHTAGLYDIIRLDHFRGFAKYWEIPAQMPTAVKGVWQPGPGALLFDQLFRDIPSIRLIAEDLGIVTPDVNELRQRFRLPGMKILQFAFTSDPTQDPYIPVNHERHSVVYTGTHDNNTLRGWFEEDIDGSVRQRINDYTAQNVTADTVHWVFIRLAFSSVADMAIIPMQDLLGLGSSCRMNTPSRSTGNWRWRLTNAQLTSEIQRILLLITRTYGRAPPMHPLKKTSEKTPT